MRIDLHNFFKYYDDTIVHHREAIDELEKALLKVAPELLEDTSEWIDIYRNKPEPKPEPADIVLPVPFYPQTDNYTQPERTCNSSSCAMALEYFRPGTLRGPKGDDAYVRDVMSEGDTADHSAQTRVLKEYGVESAFKYDLTFEDLDRELAAKRPVVLGILQWGTLTSPTGGHMIVVIGRNKQGYVCHDPYGDIYDVYTSPVYNGKSVIYERHVLEARWTVEGPGSGWGRIFYSEVEKKQSEAGKVPRVGIDLIKEFEGLHQLKADGMVYAYPDPLSGAEPYTIGYGSTKDIDGSPFELGDKITREKAELLLEQQLKYSYLSVLEKTIPHWDLMNDNQHGALLSFAYNLGAYFYGNDGFKTITRVLTEKAWHKVPDALYLYRNPGTSVEAGLARRRIAEGDLWAS